MAARNAADNASRAKIRPGAPFMVHTAVRDMGESVMDIAGLIASRDPAEIVTCPADATVRQAVRLLADKRIGALPVMQEGQVVGIFSERDVLYRLANEGALCLDRQVAEAMTSPPVAIAPETSFIEALGLMTRRRIRHLPVMEGDAMAGFISIGDIVKARIDEISAEAEHMRQYIQTA
jgi:CBS domain-containing protein